MVLSGQGFAQKVTLDPCSEEMRAGAKWRRVLQIEGKANREALSGDFVWGL